GFNGLTYDDVYNRSLVHRGMRIPARFSVIVGAGLALLGGFGARRTLRLGRTPLSRACLCAALTLAVLFDLRIDPHLRPYSATIPSIYDCVTPDMVVADLPRPQRDRVHVFLDAPLAAPDRRLQRFHSGGQRARGGAGGVPVIHRCRDAGAAAS